VGLTWSYAFRYCDFEHLVVWCGLLRSLLRSRQLKCDPLARPYVPRTRYIYVLIVDANSELLAGPHVCGHRYDILLLLLPRCCKNQSVARFILFRAFYHHRLTIHYHLKHLPRHYSPRYRYVESRVFRLTLYSICAGRGRRAGICCILLLLQ
jgi:hypothetical protein